MRYVQKDLSDIRLKNAIKFLDAEEKKKEINKLDPSYLKDYGNTDVRDALRLIYQGRCAYCGSFVGDTSSFELEHFYPKSENSKKKGKENPEWYRDFVRNFRNFHFSCRRCNTVKSTNDPFKIYSPNFYQKERHENSSTQIGTWAKYTENDFTSNFQYNGIKLMHINERSEKSVEFFDLNNTKNKRPFLIITRLRVYTFAILLKENVVDAIEAFQRSRSDTTIKYTLIKLATRNLIELFNMMRYDYPFAEMIQDNFYKDACDLEDIICELSK